MALQRRKMKSLVKLELKPLFFFNYSRFSCSLGCSWHAVKHRLFLKRWLGGGPGVLGVSLCPWWDQERSVAVRSWCCPNVQHLEWSPLPGPGQIFTAGEGETTLELLWALLRMVYVWCTIRQKNQSNERGCLKNAIYFSDSELNNFRISSPWDAKCSVKSFTVILQYELTS